MCPWSWKRERTASNLPSRARWKTESAGTGPVTWRPEARASSIPGPISRISSSPIFPPSPAWGLRAATAILGEGKPSSRRTRAIVRRVSRTRARVTWASASRRARWRVRKKIRRLPITNMVSDSELPASAASISVWPGYGYPAAHSASLWRGAVAIAWTSPASASRTARSTACAAARRRLDLPHPEAPEVDVPEVEDVHPARLVAARIGRGDGLHAEPEPQGPDGVGHHAQVAHHEGPRDPHHLRVGHGLRDDLGPDTCGVAHGDRHTGAA